jgi:hypothetical protein
MKGANRIGAGRLYQLATFLNVNIEVLLEGIEAQRSNTVIGDSELDAIVDLR